MGLPRTAQPLLLTDLLAAERVKIPLEADSKEQLLRELVQVVTAGNGGVAADEILRAVTEREAVLSTGIGQGVAIPHGKTAALSQLRMAAGRTTDPVDFDALDGRPVSLFFLLVGPESEAGAHIRALSRISRLVRRDDVREQLLTAPDGASFLAALREAES